MFHFQDCFASSGIFNENLRNSFRDTFDSKRGDKLWVIPGHLVYTSSRQKLYTCDAKPFDAPSVTDRECVELTVTIAPIVDIFFDLSKPFTRMFVVLFNGDVLIFEYRSSLFEWARVGFFNVNIISPNNSNNQHNDLEYSFISTSQNVIYWTEKMGEGEMNFVLYRRSLPHPGVREITQSTIGDRQMLLKNCPPLELIEVQDSICIVPNMPKHLDIFLLASQNFTLRFFSLNGKCLWRGVFTNYAIDFLSLCLKTVGLWSKNGAIKVCHVLDSKKNVVYLIQNSVLYSVFPSGEINRKSVVECTMSDSCVYYIYKNILCVFTGISFEFCSLESGQLLQIICLKKFIPICGLWSYSFDVPSVGFYSDSTIQQLHFKPLKSVLKSDSVQFAQSEDLFLQEDVHLVLLLKSLIQHDFKTYQINNLQNFPLTLQSEALWLCLFHTCREKGFKDFPADPTELHNFVFRKQNEKFPDTKLNKMLETLVDCFCKIEQKRP